MFFCCFQEESGAQITIGKPEPKNPTDRVITIKVQNFVVINIDYILAIQLVLCVDIVFDKIMLKIGHSKTKSSSDHTACLACISFGPKIFLCSPPSESISIH